MPRWFRLIITYLEFGILLGYIFFIIAPLARIYAWFGDNERVRYRLHRHIRRFCRFFSYHCITKVNPIVRNPYEETFKKPALIIANHQSLLDLPATLMLTNRLIVMTGQWVWDSKIYGHVVRFADFFPATMSMEEMLAHISKCMKRGYSVLIFPEGTRSEDCQVHKFRRGAFHLAEQLKCDIVPVTIFGTGYLLPKRDFCLNPGPECIEIGKRVSYDEGIMGQTHGEMTRYWHKWFVENYAKLEAEFLPLVKKRD